MGRILQGILGGFSGKVGPVVGGTWKGIAYMKSYVIPANPQTVAQTAHRTKFKNFVASVKSILPTIVNNYWEMMDSGMSGFNSFVKRNFQSVSSTGILSGTTKITQGDLESSTIAGCVYTQNNGELEVSWNGVPSGNGLASDEVIIVCFHADTNELLALSDGDAIRSEESYVLNVPSGLTVGKVRAYVSFRQGADLTLKVSDSVNALSTV